MDLLDVDGDCIQFLIDPKGRLRESLGRKWWNPQAWSCKVGLVVGHVFTSGNLKELYMENEPFIDDLPIF